MKRFLRIIDWITAKSAIVSGYIAALMMLVVCYDVTMRYFFGRPTSFALDLVEYLMVYGTFMAAPLLLKEDRHVRISILIDLFPGFRMAGGIVTYALGLSVCVVLVVLGIVEIVDLIRENTWVQRPFAIPKFITRLPIPFGCLLLVIHFMRGIVQHWTELKKLRGEAGGEQPGQ